jgi:hypothetical protein
LNDALSVGERTRDPELRCIVMDVRIQIGIGRFFAAILRSAALYTLHSRSRDRAALEQALQEYRRARDVWAQFAGEAKAIYVPDLTVGPLPHQRGHWLDRLPAIDADIAAMAAQLESAGVASANSADRLDDRQRATVSCVHVPPAHFIVNQPLEILLRITTRVRPASVRLYYRHVNQSEYYQIVVLEPSDAGYRAVIPAAYTASKYPLQYFFALTQAPGHAGVYPGFTGKRANQPYFVVRSGSSPAPASLTRVPATSLTEALVSW